MTPNPNPQTCQLVRMSDSDDSLDPLLVEQTIEHIDAKINRLELSLSQKDISHDPLPKPIAAILTHLPHAHTTSSQQVTTTAFVFVPDLRLRQALADHITSTRAVTSLKNHIHLKHQRKLYHDWTRIKLQIPEPQPLPSLKKSLPRSDIVRTEQEWQTTLEMLSVDPVKRILDRVAQEPPLDLEYSPKYTNTNHLVQDPALDLKQYNDRIHLWSEAERAEFKKNLVLFDKSFAKISSFLPLKSTSDCVHYFYREKVNARFKQLLRRTPGRQKRKVDETSESLQVYLLSPDEQVEHLGPVWVEVLYNLQRQCRGSLLKKRKRLSVDSTCLAQTLTLSLQSSAALQK